MNATTHQDSQDTPERVKAWRCVCGAFLVAYDPACPCYLEKKCSRCKRENVLDRRESKAA